MLWQPTTTDGSASPLTGDFRRALQTLIDAIALRDVDLYALTLGQGEAPCMRQGDGAPMIGRDAIIESVKAWFAEKSWSYYPTVLWTFELERTAMALLDITYSTRNDRGSIAEKRGLQLLVFQRPHDGWRLILDHRIKWCAW